MKRLETNRSFSFKYFIIVTKSTFGLPHNNMMLQYISTPQPLGLTSHHYTKQDIVTLLGFEERPSNRHCRTLLFAGLPNIALYLIDSYTLLTNIFPSFLISLSPRCKQTKPSFT